MTKQKADAREPTSRVLNFTRGNARRALELVLQVTSVSGLTSSAEGAALVSSAMYLLALGDAAAAQDAARAALLLSSRVQHPYMAVNAILQMATAFAVQGELRRSARLFGFINAWLAVQGCEWEADAAKSHALLAATLQQRLMPQELAALTAAGARLDADQAVDAALAPSDTALK